MCINQARPTWGHPDIRRPPIQSIYNSKTHNRGNVHQSSTIHLGHPIIRKPQVRSICNSKTRNRGNSKLLGRITVIVFNVPSPYIYHFPKLLKKKSVEPRHWQVTTQFTKFEPVPIYLELSFILHTKFLFFDGNT